MFREGKRSLTLSKKTRTNPPTGIGDNTTAAKCKNSVAQRERNKVQT